MADDATSGIERAVASALYLPLGVGAKIVDDLPEAIDKARQQITTARFVGKLVVDQGVREMRDRVSTLLDSQAPQSNAPSPAGDSPSVVVDPPPEAPAPPSVEPPDVADAGSPDELALPDYDQLPAAHIVRKLAGLTQHERDLIEAHELANRHRRTVLGKLDQLRDRP